MPVITGKPQEKNFIKLTRLRKLVQMYFENVIWRKYQRAPNNPPNDHSETI